MIREVEAPRLRLVDDFAIGLVALVAALLVGVVTGITIERELRPSAAAIAPPAPPSCSSVLDIACARNDGGIEAGRYVRWLGGTTWGISNKLTITEAVGNAVASDL